MNAENSGDSDRQRKILDKLITVMGETHGRDVSVYKVSFLAKSLEKRRRCARGTP